MSDVAFTLADIEEVIDWGMSAHIYGRPINVELLDVFIGLKNRIIDFNRRGLPLVLK